MKGRRSPERAGGMSPADAIGEEPMKKMTKFAAMAAALCADHLGGEHLLSLYLIELELLRVSKVLKNLSIFIRNCDSHLFFLLL